MAIYLTEKDGVAVPGWYQQVGDTRHGPFSSWTEVPLNLRPAPVKLPTPEELRATARAEALAARVAAQRAKRDERLRSRRATDEARLARRLKYKAVKAAKQAKAPTAEPSRRGPKAQRVVPPPWSHVTVLNNDVGVDTCLVQCVCGTQFSCRRRKIRIGYVSRCKGCKVIKGPNSWYINNCVMKVPKDFPCEIIGINKHAYSVQLRCPECGDVFGTTPPYVENGTAVKCRKCKDRVAKRGAGAYFRSPIKQAWYSVRSSKAVLPEWAASFEVFKAAVGTPPPGHMIRRIFSDVPYGPTNFAWVPRSERYKFLPRARHD